MIFFKHYRRGQVAFFLADPRKVGPSNRKARLDPHRFQVTALRHVKPTAGLTTKKRLRGTSEKDESKEYRESTQAVSLL
jgi:hypothetical protein